MSKLTLLSFLECHFFIEHVRWHHRMVATPEDHASAKKGDIVYAHILRSTILSYFNAWKIANKDMTNQGKSWFSLENEMVQYMIVQSSLVYFVYRKWG